MRSLIGLSLIVLAFICLCFSCEAWGMDGPPPGAAEVAAAPAAPTAPAAPAPVADLPQGAKREESDDPATATAGPIDLASLLRSLRDPFDLVDKGLTDRLEAMAQRLAVENPEIGLGRTVAFLAYELTEVWKKYTAETLARSEEVQALHARHTAALEAASAAQASLQAELERAHNDRVAESGRAGTAEGQLREARNRIADLEREKTHG